MFHKMSIRAKTILLIGAMLLVFIGFLVVVSYFYVTQRHEKMEQDDIESHLARIHNEFQAKIDVLKTTSIDWGQWDDTYEFVENNNSDYVNANLSDGSLENLGVNFMLFYDIDGQLVHQKIISLYPDVPKIDRSSLLDAIQGSSSILSTKELRVSTSGIFIAESSVYLLASHYIINSFADKPVIGTLVIGRRLDSFEIQQIGERAETRLTVRPIDKSDSIGDFQDYLAGKHTIDIAIKRVDSDTVFGYSMIEDLERKQRLKIKIEVDRGIYRQGIQTWRKNAFAMIAWGSIFIILLLLILDRSIFNRLRILSENVSNLSCTGEKLDRLDVGNNDELGKLANSINNMLKELNRHHVALIESETKYRKFFDQDLTGDVLSSADGTIVDCNAACAKIFGYGSAEELKQRNVNFFYPPGVRHTILERLRKEKKIERLQLEFVGRGNRPLFCIGNIIGEFDSDGTLTHTIAYFFDDTKRVLLEKNLRKTQKMEAVGTLAGGIAHDFNNLLQPILGYTQLVINDLPVDSPLKEYLKRIADAGTRAKDLVQQILTFSRKSPHKKIIIPIQKVLEEVIKLCRSTIPSNIEIEHDFQINCPPVMADPTQLHQVAMNLIINAYHAIEQPVGKITIQVKECEMKEDGFRLEQMKPGRYAMLSVSDTGCGMDNDTIDKIFEPYFTTKELGKGTGLGLAVVYGIVQEYNGEIQVNSEVGKGTTINIYLPIVVEHANYPEELVPQACPGGQESILLIDDEKAVLEMVCNMLERLGYQVTISQNSTEALQTLTAAREAFDLIITDMTMPGLTGDQLAEKALEISPTIPIILCTGFSERISERRAREIGIKNFLMKPFAMADLARSVRQTLDG